MIQTLAFANYRSLRDLKIALDPLTVITGQNGSGKSNLYRALRLLAGAADGGIGEALAREGGLPSALWAGGERVRSFKKAAAPQRAQGSVRSEPVRLKLGFAADEISYALELGLPQPTSSRFSLDAEIKAEAIWQGELRRRSNTWIERQGGLAHGRDPEGKSAVVSTSLRSGEAVFSQIGDPRRFPEVLHLRETLRSWRFYDQFRSDPDSPIRQPQIGVRTTALASDGRDLAAALGTILEIGDREALAAAVDAVFPGATLQVYADNGRFSLGLQMPGLLRELGGAELSDGSLRYLCLLAALLSPRPAPLIVLNEPEASLHESVLPPLAQLILGAAKRSQILVISHSQQLVAAIESESSLAAIELLRENDETRIGGQSLLDEPVWHWL